MAFSSLKNQGKQVSTCNQAPPPSLSSSDQNNSDPDTFASNNQHNSNASSCPIHNTSCGYGIPPEDRDLTDICEPPHLEEDGTRPGGGKYTNAVIGEVGTGGGSLWGQKPSDQDCDDSDSDDSDSDYSGDHAVLNELPEGLKTVKPLITNEELEYGAMEIVQNPWEYIDGKNLPASTRALLDESIREYAKFFLPFSLPCFQPAEQLYHQSGGCARENLKLTTFPIPGDSRPYTNHHETAKGKLQKLDTSISSSWIFATSTTEFLCDLATFDIFYRPIITEDPTIRRGELEFQEDERCRRGLQVCNWKLWNYADDTNETAQIVLTTPEGDHYYLVAPETFHDQLEQRKRWLLGDWEDRDRASTER